MTSAKQSGLLFDVARFSEKDAQFDGNLKSMEALIYRARPFAISFQMQSLGLKLRKFHS
jgi:hypothetical protein